MPRLRFRIRSSSLVGRLITQPALFYAKGKGQAPVPASKDLPCVFDNEILDALFPLQERPFPSSGEIVHAALSSGQVSQKSTVIVDCEGREMDDIKSLRRANQLITVRKGSDRILSLTQMVKVVRHPKPGIGISTITVLGHIGSARAIRNIKGDLVGSSAISRRNDDLDLIGRTHPARDDSNATSESITGGIL